jgi:hypothetical protein
VKRFVSNALCGALNLSLFSLFSGLIVALILTQHSYTCTSGGLAMEPFYFHSVGVVTNPAPKTFDVSPATAWR